jgi:starch phosphorylase
MDAHAMSEFHPEPVGTDRESLKRSIANRLLYTVGKDPHAAHPRDWLTALAHVVRDRLVERWMATTRAQYQQDVKRVYYFSVEYLIGRALTNGLLALGVYDDCRAALAEMGIELSQLEALEEDAALGNGGLGRLAACFLDSMATLDLPGFGYGIRYDYGMFAQAFKDGWQVEHPDHWLAAGNPWEFPRSEVVYPVKFGGRVERRDGVAHWVDSDDVLAMAYDTIVPGYGTHAVNTLRLWSAKSTRDIDLAAFNRGHYSLAVEAKNRSENVSRVLYPDDSSAEGRELRLRQEYFFVSASLQDILRRFRSDHQDWDLLPDKAAVHLNDTHPALAVPELMRLLTDVHGLPWDQAWALSGRVFSYTNHTLMPEALETWPTELLGRVLPRILEIILKINGRFLERVSETPGADLDLLSQVSLIEEDGQQRARMGHLSVLASHKINGVSAIHSGLVRDTLAGRADRHPDRRRLAGRPGPAGRPGALGRGPGAGRGLPRHQDRQQDPPGQAGGRPDRRDPGPGLPVRRPRQADPRIQAPAAQPAAGDRPLQPHQGGARRGLGAAQRDLRRQGGLGLLDGQADHQADQRRGPDGQRRPGGGRPPQDCLRAEL